MEEKVRHYSPDLNVVQPRDRQATSASRKSEEEGERSKALTFLAAVLDDIGCFPLLVVGMVTFIGLKFYPRLLEAFGQWCILSLVAVIICSALLYIILLLTSSIQKSLGKPGIEVSLITTIRLVVAIPVTIAVGAFSLLVFFPLETLLFLILFPFVAIFEERAVAMRFQTSYPRSLRWLPDFLNDLRGWVWLTKETTPS